MHSWTNKVMSLQCDVIFDKNPTKVFYVGQTVRGYVRLVVKKLQIFRGIRVKICGKAVAKWQLKRAIRQCEEECLNHQMSVLGNFFGNNLRRNTPGIGLRVRNSWRKLGLSSNSICMTQYFV